MPNTSFNTHLAFSFSKAEQYIYVAEAVTMHWEAEELCEQRDHHLAVVDTDERQHMFSIAMAIEYKWVHNRRL